MGVRKTNKEFAAEFMMASQQGVAEGALKLIEITNIMKWCDKKWDGRTMNNREALEAAVSSLSYYQNGEPFSNAQAAAIDAAKPALLLH